MITFTEIKMPPELASMPEIVASVIPDIAEAVRTHLVSLAHDRLQSSSQDYVAGIMPVQYHYPAGKIPVDRVSVVATIALVGVLPNLLEQGWAGGDMKPALLMGRNSKIGKDGTRYNTVPFRQGTPGVTGRNFPEMGSQFKSRLGQEDAARLGREVHKAAKKLRISRSTEGGPTAWGGRLPAGMAPRLRPHHKTDVFAGMVRFGKKYERAVGHQYMTFRRVSENSDPMAWIHPGINPAHLFKEAATYASKVSSIMMQGVLRGGG